MVARSHSGLAPSGRHGVQAAKSRTLSLPAGRAGCARADKAVGGGKGVRIPGAAWQLGLERRARLGGRLNALRACTCVPWSAVSCRLLRVARRRCWLLAPAGCTAGPGQPASPQQRRAARSSAHPAHAWAQHASPLLGGLPAADGRRRLACCVLPCEATGSARTAHPTAAPSSAPQSARDQTIAAGDPGSPAHWPAPRLGCQAAAGLCTPDEKTLLRAGQTVTQACSLPVAHRLPQIGNGAK